MEGVGDQGDDDVDLGDLSVEGLSIVDIELGELVFAMIVGEKFAYADRLGVGDTLGQSLCLLESPTGDDDLDARLAENLSSWAGNKASTKQQNRPGNQLVYALRVVAQLHSLSGRIDAAENGLELVCVQSVFAQ